MTVAAAFDRIAQHYDEAWTNTDIGRAQREAVWRHLDPLFKCGSRIVDLGCGTGEDALHFSRAGVHVSAFDASAEMVRMARARGADANLLAVEELDRIEGTWDGAVSNFGALNCVSDLSPLRVPLARMIRPDGYLAICVIGRFCLRETLHFLRRGQFGEASRRWPGSSESRSLGIRAFYPTVRQIQSAFAADFLLVQTVGVGLFVPPSYVSPLFLALCDSVDRRIAHRRFFRALSDHRLLVFVRK